MRRKAPSLAAAAIAFSALTFWPAYLYHLILTLLASIGMLNRPGVSQTAILLWLLKLPSLWLFTDSARYVTISLAGLALIVAAFLWARPRHSATRLALGLGLLSILAFPWFYRYQLAVEAAPGHTMQVLTQPGLLEGVAKRAQVSLEIRPCEYTLLGWTPDNTLHYRAVCENRPAQVWAYDPQQSSLALKAAEPFAKLVQDTPGVTVLDQVRASGVYPPEEEFNARRMAVRGSGLLSPNGHWVAVLVQHLYGPQDILILEQPVKRQ